VGGHAEFRMFVHLPGADLHFNGAPLGISHGGMQ
jgi:hypothetical protein